MPLVAFSIKLGRIDERLLYQDKGGGWWLSAVCTLEEDAKGRMVVAQSVPKERFAAGERGPGLGTWRQIGGASKPSQNGKATFDLAKYRGAATVHNPAPGAAKYPDGQEGLFPSPPVAFGAARETQREPQAADNPPGFDEPGF